MNFEYNDLITMNINAMKHSFASEDYKEKIINCLKTYYK